MKQNTYVRPECQVHAMITEQAILANSKLFGTDNAAGAEMFEDKWLEDL